MATTNVCHLNGKYIVNPSADERAAADCFVCIASTFEKVVMIETEANEAPESVVLEAIRIAHETNMEIVKFINGIVAEIGKPKFTFEKAAVNHDLLDDLMAYGLDQIEYALDTDDKNVREERLTAARVDFANKFADKYEDFETNIEVCLYKMQKKVVKKWLLAGKRVDGRGMDEIRPLAASRSACPGPRFRTLHPWPDPGAFHLHPEPPVCRSEAGYHLSGGDQAVYPSLQFPLLLHR
mgnify:CR=1 FL=1